MKELLDNLDRIKELTDIQLEDETIYHIITHTNEEWGEFCAAVCVEDGGKAKAYKNLNFGERETPRRAKVSS